MQNKDQTASAQPAGADLITYTVDGVVMSPLEYIDYLHDKLATLAPVAAQQAAAVAAPILTEGFDDEEEEHE